MDFGSHVPFPQKVVKIGLFGKSLSGFDEIGHLGVSEGADFKNPNYFSME